MQAAIGRGRAIRDQRLIDVETRDIVQEVETGRDLGGAQVLDRILDGFVDEEADNEDKQELVGDPAQFGIVEK